MDVALYSAGGVGRPLPPSAAYAVKLEVEGKNYTRTVELSHSLQPEEADRFLVHVGVARSSRHRFRVHLALSSGERVSSEFVEVEAFMPRSMVEVVASHPLQDR